MTLNFSLIDDLRMTSDDVLLLQACYQNSGDLDDYINRLSERCNPEILSGMVVRTKKGSARLTKEGRELIKKLHSPGVTTQDEAIADYLISLYQEDESKIVCHKDKLTKLIVWLRNTIGMTPKQLFKLIEIYFTDEEASKYNKKLEYLIYKPNSVYAGVMSLKNGESRLYSYYMSNQKAIDKLLTDL